MRMPDAKALRVLRVFADDTEVGADCRIRLQGKSTMTCLPDPWQIDIYVPQNEDRAALNRCSSVRVLGENNSVLCSGEPADVLSRRSDGREVVEVLIMEGEGFWQSSVSLTLAAGVTVDQTIRALLGRCSSPIPLASSPSLLATIPRAQSFFGRTADAVDELARAADCRGWVWQEALWLTKIGDGVPRATIHEEDLLRDPESMTGALLCETRMVGLQTGQLVRLDTDNWNGIYRLASQRIDADNYNGAWSNSLTLMDETEAGLGVEVWEGIM